jgi:hypothetical protein
MRSDYVKGRRGGCKNRDDSDLAGPARGVGRAAQTRRSLGRTHITEPAAGIYSADVTGLLPPNVLFCAIAKTLLSIVVAVILVFSAIALLLKVNSGAKQAPAKELFTGSIGRSPAIRKSPSNESMAAFLALDSSQAAIRPMQRMVDRAAVPLPRPRPKRL